GVCRLRCHRRLDKFVYRRHLALKSQRMAFRSTPPCSSSSPLDRSANSLDWRGGTRPRFGDFAISAGRPNALAITNLLWAGGHLSVASAVYSTLASPDRSIAYDAGTTRASAG